MSAPADRASQRTAVTRTLKFLDALLAGAWVLILDWILQSYVAGRWLPERGFEVVGDLVGMGGLRRGSYHGYELFAGLRIHFLLSSVSERSDDLERLVLRGGAEVLRSICLLPDAAADPPHLSPEECQGMRRWRSGRRALAAPW